MTEVLRLTLVSHAMTHAMATGRFPIDEPLNDVGRRQVEAIAALDISRGLDRPVTLDVRQLTGPEQRALQTAELLGLQATVEPRLADLDYGGWRGETLSGVRADELEVWLTDPAQAPHGGESIIDLIDRVGGWLESLTANRSRTVAVTHAAVIRTAILLALDAPPKSFWRIDIAPVSRTVMYFRGHSWTLRAN